MAAVVVVALIVAGLVAASGDDDEQPVASDSPATTVATVSERPLLTQETLYAPITGYTIAELPTGALDVVRSPFDNIPDLKGKLRELSGRNLTRNGTPVAQILVWQFDPLFTAQRNAADEFRRGVTSTASESENITVAGQEAAYYKVGSVVDGIVALKGSVAVMVQGPHGVSRQQLTQLFSTMLARIP